MEACKSLIVFLFISPTYSWFPPPFFLIIFDPLNFLRNLPMLDSVTQLTVVGTLWTTPESTVPSAQLSPLWDAPLWTLITLVPLTTWLYLGNSVSLPGSTWVAPP